MSSKSWNVRLRAAADMNFAEGTLWSEPGAGTNAIGTALAVDHAVQVFGPEHYSDPVQRWTCSAAPIHDPDTGELLGIIDLTGDLNTVHPHSLAVATATARAVEASLALVLQERDARLHARYGDRVTPGPRRAGHPVRPAHHRRAARLGRGRPPGHPARRRRADAAQRRARGGRAGQPGAGGVPGPRHGRRAPPPTPARCSGSSCSATTGPPSTTPQELRPRLAEILAVLCAAPHGLSAEALCAELHGDGGSVSSVRVEVSRLRKLIGPWVGTDVYRLTCDVESDVRRVEGLLAAGQVRAAAEAYTGPLLPASDAPGVVREREHLDDWLRQAVMTAEDPDALWAWVHSPSGEDDLGAWKRLLVQLEFRDPRRPLAAARVGELRRAALM